MKFSTYTSAGEQYYGASTDAGMIALNDRFQQWPTLFDAVQANGLGELASAARSCESLLLGTNPIHTAVTQVPQA